MKSTLSSYIVCSKFVCYHCQQRTYYTSTYICSYYCIFATNDKLEKSLTIHSSLGWECSMHPSNLQCKKIHKNEPFSTIYQQKYRDRFCWFYLDCFCAETLICLLYRFLVIILVVSKEFPKGGKTRRKPKLLNALQWNFLLRVTY